MDEDVTLDLLAKRCRRACKAVLNAKEEMLDSHIPLESSRKFRKVVLDEINGFHELCADVVASLTSGSNMVVNELYLEKLDDIHTYITSLDIDYDDEEYDGYVEANGNS